MGQCDVIKTMSRLQFIAAYLYFIERNSLDAIILKYNKGFLVFLGRNLVNFVAISLLQLSNKEFLLSVLLLSASFIQ